MSTNDTRIGPFVSDWNMMHALTNRLLDAIILVVARTANADVSPTFPTVLLCEVYVYLCMIVSLYSSR